LSEVRREDQLAKDPLQTLPRGTKPSEKEEKEQRLNATYER
jgi:hypothetical protein